MLRSIQGSQVTVDGSTFNDAAGNMNQTFTTIVSHQRIDPPSSTGDDIRMMTQVPSLTLHLAKSRTVHTHVNGSAPYYRSGLVNIILKLELSPLPTNILLGSNRRAGRLIDTAIRYFITRPSTPAPPTDRIGVPCPRIPAVWGASRIANGPQGSNSQYPSRDIQQRAKKHDADEYHILWGVWCAQGIDLLYHYVVTSALHDSGEDSKNRLVIQERAAKY
ncbi:hypothetical protein C8J57DRAFT_1537566 [Mycena rebaudengoi]|nr:hypothetical protein C8J57DRAFT_1537566 [Mycena rebaudengoi]